MSPINAQNRALIAALETRLGRRLGRSVSLACAERAGCAVAIVREDVVVGAVRPGDAGA